MVSQKPKRKLSSMPKMRQVTQSQQMAPKKPKRRLVYFRPGQITFLATHQEDSVSEERLRAWVAEIQEFLEGWQITWPPRTFSFPPPPEEEYEYKSSNDQEEQLRGAFSIIVCDVEKGEDDSSSLRELIVRLDRKLRRKSFAELRVEAVSPNWLASGAPDGGAVGGPGGRPVPFRGTPDRAPYSFRELLALLDKKGIRGDGTGVDVAILDTAPCPHDLIAAFKEWKDRHPLIRTLLGPGSPLRLYPATYDELLRMGSTSLNRHDYEMADHGLFAAGIVHTIAPKATIHLIEVLNPFGVGDLETIARGLEKAYNVIRKPDRRLVVNCSLMLDLPLQLKHCYAKSASDPEHAFERRILGMVNRGPKSPDGKRQVFALKAMCDRLGDVGRQAIAAAGNDWREKSDRLSAPTTRYPAAFSRTVGVGALPKDSKPDRATGKYEASSYSNLADKPPETGIMTLGGEPGEEQGGLGLYLGQFPGCEENCTKWAWWAGTSFATPILTGAIAAVLSKATGPRTTQEAIHALYTNGIISEEQTLAKEDALLTEQDYPGP